LHRLAIDRPHAVAAAEATCGWRAWHRLEHREIRVGLHVQAGCALSHDLRVDLALRHRIHQLAVQVAVAHVGRHELLPADRLETRQRSRCQQESGAAREQGDIGEIEMTRGRRVSRHAHGVVEIHRRSRSEDDPWDRHEE